MKQTKRAIMHKLSAAGLRPLRQYGQHFLIDGNLMNKLVEAAGLRSDDTVLEVGPGTGALTERLLESAGHVVAVEIDQGLTELCRTTLALATDKYARLTLLHGDILEKKSRVSGRVMQELLRRQAELGGRILLAANLPYQVATPLLAELIMGPTRISPLCFTVQAEVGERLRAGPGGKTYGPISVFAQAAAEIQTIVRVPPTAFWPRPKVDSVMLRLDLRPEAARAALPWTKLNTLVRGCFNHRRKTLKAILRSLVTKEELPRIEHAGRWELTRRPENLTVAEWLELAAYLRLEHLCSLCSG